MRAVNLIAFMNTALDLIHLPLYLLLDQLVTDVVVCPYDRIGHEALIVSEDVSNERWAAVKIIIRRHFRTPEFPLYEKHDGRWRIV